MTTSQSLTTGKPSKARPVVRELEYLAIELIAQGHSQREAAEILGRSLSVFRKMLARTEEKLALLLKDEGQRLRARQTKQLEAIYRAAMKA